ncbi:MAG: prepilin-type N-terminal cleavage/methylation domain-containing protein [Deltaproteobacteria bacterium]|nr:prepilin-type N-terminal cleavage/methylation domain-containing protein [Deltaproteobacteria bacterium]
MSRKRGLTLIEVVVALALLGIIAAVGVPYLLAGLPVLRVNAAVRQVLGDLRLARTLSIERGLDVLLSFDGAGSQRYRLAIDTHPAHPANDHQITPHDEIVKTVDLADLSSGIGLSSSDPGAPPGGVSFANETAIFTPDGKSSTGSVYLQPLVDCGVRNDRDRKVTVVGATGRAKAYAWGGAGWE